LNNTKDIVAYIEALGFACVVEGTLKFTHAKFPKKIKVEKTQNQNL
jgi:hypothetical protein